MPQPVRVLGPLCIHEHRAAGTDLSLVYAKTRECVECQRQWSLKWRAKRAQHVRDVALRRYYENREYYRAQRQAYSRTPQGRMSRRRSRARRIPAVVTPYTAAQMAEHWRRFGDLCAYCSAPATTVDHVRALAAGGAEALSNLAPACRRCNLSKGARPVEAWYRRQPFYNPVNFYKLLYLLGLWRSDTP